MNALEIINKLGLFWQYPVITEKTFYEQERYNLNYFGIPWATIIDKKYNLNIVLGLLKQVHGNSQKEYYTCCQHISFRKLIPLWKQIGVTTVYSSHKVTKENNIDGIEIRPCPLYAVSIEDSKKNENIQNVDFLTCERSILYSFVGSYSQYYISNIRSKIFQLPKKDDVHIVNRGKAWHFDPIVYDAKQNKKGELNETKSHQQNTYEYNELLLKSRYTLCPSGTGPNSIRFWEAMSVGSIPVLLSDTLELPEHELWDSAIIKVKEEDVDKVDDILRKISLEDEGKHRENCLKLYSYFKDNYKNDVDTKTLFTSFKCEKNDPTVLNILDKWTLCNPTCNVLYFSDNDVNTFFSKTNYYDIYKKMRNGVAIADFFRICYIQKYGGYWFDIDLEATPISFPNNGRVHLFDSGYKNISYMFIGGQSSQKIFEDVIKKVIGNINNNIKSKKQGVMEITGPRVIQNIIFERLKIENKDGCLPSKLNEHILYLKDTEYEFVYTGLKFEKTKTNDYRLLQQKYGLLPYSAYNYI